ncbi:MAG: glycerol-3-phosphate dehydrogenase/oxidase [Planctomycetota bacterium]
MGAPVVLAAGERLESVAAMARTPLDVLVVGGGATGAAIVREAALAGMRAGLIERDDFAAHTSSASSKLIHGGLRYLEHGHLRLVREGLHERRTLMQLAPHLVQRLEFLLPIYRSDRHAPWKVRLGLFLYQQLARDCRIGRHEMLSAGALLDRLPELGSDGLVGGASYFDARTDDGRLVLAMLLSAAAAGALVANHVAAVALLRQDGSVRGVVAKDRVTGATFEIECKQTINATGPFADRWLLEMGVLEHARLAPSLGCHIVLASDRLPLPCALLLHAPADGRVVFAVPWYGQTVIGTTETAIADVRAPVMAGAGDVDYLLDIVRHAFPRAALTRDDVKSTWAGLRPLIGSRHGTRNLTNLARDFQVFEAPRGLKTIVGGKLTAMRRMAQVLLGSPAVVAARSRTVALVGAPPDSPAAGIEALRRACPALDGLAAEWLFMRHGSQASTVVHAGAGLDQDGLQPLVRGLPFLECELVHAARAELVVTLADVLERRLPIAALDVAAARAAAARAARLVAPILGWDAAEQARQIADFESACLRYDAWRGQDRVARTCLSGSVRRN